MKNQVFHLVNYIKDYSVIKKAGRGGGTYGEMDTVCAALDKLDCMNLVISMIKLNTAWDIKREKGFAESWWFALH